MRNDAKILSSEHIHTKCGHCFVCVHTTQLTTLEELIRLIILSNPNTNVHCAFKSCIDNKFYYWIYYGNSRELIYIIEKKDEGNCFYFDTKTWKIGKLKTEEIRNLEVEKKIVYFCNSEFGLIQELA